MDFFVNFFVAAVLAERHCFSGFWEKLSTKKQDI